MITHPNRRGSSPSSDVATPSPAARTGTLSLLGLLLAVAVIAAACGGGGGDDTPRIELGQDDPSLAPDSDDVQVEPGTGPDDEFAGLEYGLFEGGTSTIGSYQGTPLVVNFFAAWCPSCITEMPDFENVFKSLEGEVAFLGLSQDADPQDALDLVAQTGISYDIGWDPELDVYMEFGGLAMPTTVFFTADGELTEVFAGALNEDGLRERIDEIRS